MEPGPSRGEYPSRTLSQGAAHRSCATSRLSGHGAAIDAGSAYTQRPAAARRVVWPQPGHGGPRVCSQAGARVDDRCCTLRPDLLRARVGRRPTQLSLLAPCATATQLVSGKGGGVWCRCRAAVRSVCASEEDSVNRARVAAGCYSQVPHHSVHLRLGRVIGAVLLPAHFLVVARLAPPERPAVRLPRRLVVP